jgi:hypothetical protein
MDGLIVVAIGVVITIFVLAFGRAATMWFNGAKEIVTQLKETQAVNENIFKALQDLKAINGETNELIKKAMEE